MNEVTYTIIAKVDGLEVFTHEYPDTAMLQESLGKAELAVERSLE